MKMKDLSVLTLLFFTLVAFVFLHSCETKVKKVEPAQLEGYWVLKSLNGTEAKNLFEGALPTLQFDFTEMKVYGTGGCNRYSGAFSLDEKNKFSAPDLATTRMLCTGANEEGQFLVEMMRPSTLYLEDDNLVFKADGETATLVFEKGEPQAEPETIAQKLSGVWTLAKMNGKDVGEIFKGEGTRVPTLTFDFDNGRISGHGGCNGFSAPFQYDNGLIIVSDVAATQMACPNLQGEGQYFKNLTDTSAVSIPDNQNLQLIKKGDMVLEYKKTE